MGFASVTAKAKAIAPGVFFPRAKTTVNVAAAEPQPQMRLLGSVLGALRISGSLCLCTGRVQREAVIGKK